MVQQSDIQPRDNLNVLQRYSDDAHRLRKRATPECYTNCGIVSVSDCAMRLIKQDNPPPNVCSDGKVFIDLGECETTFAGHKPAGDIVCISQETYSELIKEVFDACVNNTKTLSPVGGCIDAGNEGAKVCIRNQAAANCF